MADQSLIDSAISPPQSASVIDSALAPAQTSSKIDAAVVPPQAQNPLRGAVQATSISASTPSILDRISAMLGSQAPEGSVMANITGQRGTRGTPQLIAPEAAMTPMEQFRHPVATGVLKTAGGITSPENALILAGTGGLGSLPGAAGRIVPRLVSLGFSASMVKGIYDRVPELRNQVNAYNEAQAKGDKQSVDSLESGIKQTIAELATSGVFAALTGTHAVRGGKASPAAETTEPATPEATPVETASVTPNAQPIESAPVVSEQASPQPAGMPAEVAPRIQQNAEALRPVVDPENIQTRGDVQSTIDRAANVIRTNQDPRMGARLSFEEQQWLAQNLGMTPEQLLATPSGQAFNAEQVVAANAMLEASRTQVMNSARLAATGDAAYQQQFLEDLARHQEIQQTVTERVAAEAGRALGAFRNAPNEGTIQAAINALSKLDDAARLEAANRLSKIDPNNAAAVAKFTREITPSSTADKLYEAWMNGVLSGGTVIVKGASDVTMRTLGIFTRGTSGAIDAARAALTGTPRERFTGEVKADVYGMLRGWSKASAQFSDTFFHELGMGEGPLDTGYRTQAIKGPLGKIIRTPTRALEAVTDAAKILNYSAALHAEGYRQAIREGLNGDAAMQRAEQLAADPTPEMQESAGQYGKEQTFQQKLGPIGQQITKLRDAVPGGKYLLPFIKTPANILKTSIDYSPLGLIKTGVKAARGSLEGGALSDALAKNSLGTALAGTVIYHALQGNITGSGPTNPKDRLRLEQQGWQPYSVKVGNRFVSYRKLEPVGTVMSLAADVAEAIKSGTGPLAGGLGSSLFDKVKENMKNAEFIGSLMRLNQIFEGPGKYARGLIDTVIPTAVANIAKATDRTVRSPQTVLEQLESRIPGLTQKVPALQTPNRQPLQRPASALGGFNPYPVSTGSPSLAALENLLQRQAQIRQAQQARKQLIKDRQASRRPH